MQPEAAARRVEAALEALGLSQSPHPEQQALTASILRYVDLLHKWSRTYNLTAVRDPDRMLAQHIFDSAAVLPVLRPRVEARRRVRNGEPARPTIVDVGSGAGLPGIVLALLWREADFVLVEPVAKKAAFLQQAVLELPLPNVRVARSRIEDLAQEAIEPDAIVCRAFASLADYAAAIDGVAVPHTLVTAMKAQLDKSEKSALTNDWRILEEVPLDVPELDAPRTLVVLARSASESRAAESES